MDPIENDQMVWRGMEALWFNHFPLTIPEIHTLMAYELLDGVRVLTKF